MKLGWYINRLRSMEPAEVVHRLGEKARKLVSRRLDQGWQQYRAVALQAVLPQMRDGVVAASPAQRAAIAQAAQGVLAGQFSALGRAWPPRAESMLFPPELWRLDPVTGTDWPDAQTYGFEIDFRHDGSRGDIKYVWEINRLQMLPVLAAYWVQSGDARAIGAIEAAIASWHGANAPFGGVGWASGIEVAVRAISLIVTLDLMGDDLSAETRDLASRILVASAFWLPRFPSRFSSANNHLVAELAGEFLIGLALGRDVDDVRGHLLVELDKQILPDGSGAEQTPTYAAFTAELILLCAVAARQAGAPFPAAAEARLAGFADFIGWLGPMGFGDDDEGRVLTLRDEDDYAGSVAAAINGMLGRSGHAAADGDFRALVFGAPAGPVAREQGLKTFASGGLSVWHGELAGRAVDLTLDHGPLGYLSIAAHGHADALALSLDVDGAPVLVDPGTWLYGSGGVWRDWFRSTPAHNTLNIEGVSQSQMSGAFNWSHKAQAVLLDSVDGPDWRLEAEHDGYQRRFGVRHRRLVQRVGETIEILDRLLGDERQAELVFQLAPDIEARRNDNVVSLARGGVALMEIALPDAAIEIGIGGELPGQGGWVSQRFGLRSPASRIVWRGRVGATGVRSRLRVFGSSPH